MGIYGILVLCLLLRPMAFSSDNNTTDFQPSKDVPERRAKDGVYIGCYSQECLKVGFSAVLLDSTTPDSCTATCKENGFRIAALYNRTECACSCEQSCPAMLPEYAFSNYCGLPCKEHFDIFCGGFVGSSFYVVESVNASNTDCTEDIIVETNVPSTADTLFNSGHIPVYIAAGICSSIIIVLIIIFACLRKSDRRVVYSRRNHSRRWRAHAPSQGNEGRPSNDPQTTSNQPQLPPRHMSGTHQPSGVGSTSHTQTRGDGEPAIANDIRDNMPVVESSFYHVLTEEDCEETRSQGLSLATENAYAYADCRAYINSFPRSTAFMNRQVDTPRYPENNEEIV